MMIYMKGNGLMVKDMAGVSRSSLMGHSTMVIGKIIRCMEKEE